MNTPAAGGEGNSGSAFERGRIRKSWRVPFRHVRLKRMAAMVPLGRQTALRIGQPSNAASSSRMNGSGTCPQPCVAMIELLVQADQQSTAIWRFFYVRRKPWR